ncbi:putative Cytochrome P450 [Seiridium unicorne]|uniref:Cytochrome P450 n=1 Tax=Seiridium unicorne TaxID=138068 RepID=A0ABR2UGK9_9PEZI
MVWTWIKTACIDAWPSSSPLIRVSAALIIPAVVLFAVFFTSDPTRGKYPTLNDWRPFELSSTRVKKNFIANGRRLLRQGLKDFHGKPFRIITDHGPVLILPPSYTQELRNIDDLSHVRAISDIVDAKVPGFEAFYEFSYGGNIIQDVVKAKITPALNTLSEPLSEETSMALETHFGSSTGKFDGRTLRICADVTTEWHAVPLHSTLLQAVARVSSRLFLGDELCRNPDWLRITTTYTHHISKAILDLKIWPAFMRPLAIRFVPHGRALIELVHEAEELMGKVLKERQALKLEGNSPEYIDSIEWFQQVAKGRKYNPVHVQLTLSFVAIHTTADMLTQVMFDLAQHPEYIEPLRQEAIAVLKENGWSKMALYNLKLMDSVLKEVQRLRPINDTSLQRLALEDVKLADGTSLPRGTLLAVASTRHWDSEVYPEPEKFDGYRFLKLRQDQDKQNTAQFVSTSQDHLGFGHGQHACPGRFFASNEIKIILCHVLLKYDWRLVKGQEPKIIVHGFNLIADPRSSLDIRRRKEEFIIDGL